MRKRPMRIVLFRQDRIGDFVVTTPAFRTLRESFPDARIDVFCSRPVYELARRTGYFNNVYPFAMHWFGYKENNNFKGRFRGFLQTVADVRYRRFISRLKRGNYDAAIDFVGKRRNLLAAKLAGIPKIIGFNLPTGNSVLATDVVAEKDTKMSENCLNLVKILKPRKMFYKACLGRIGVKKRKAKGLGVHIGAGEEVRKYWGGWPELLEELLKSHRVILFGEEGGYESKVYDSIKALKDNKNMVDSYGKLTLMQMVNRFKGLDILVCHDSGPMHLADALGVKTIALMIPEYSKMWRPTNDGTVILMGKSATKEIIRRTTLLVKRFTKT